MDKNKLISIGKGSLIAGVGAVLTYLTQALAGVDFGAATPVVVAVLSILTNAVRKYAEPSV